MRWEQVDSWLNTLRRHDDFSADYQLSKRGVQAAMSASLESCQTHYLDEIAAIKGTPYKHVVIVLAATVATAAIEWCAVLLGRGSKVTLKISSRNPGISNLLYETAKLHDLPLHITSETDCLQQGDLVIAMGQDQTIRQIQTLLVPGTRFLGFGHRFSVVWVSAEDATTPTTWTRIALDLALHDSRGCMSPIAVLTDADVSEYWPLACQAMREAEAAIPRGTVSPIEGAQIRSRFALAKVTGTAIQGEQWSVHEIPVDLFEPMSLPRSMAVYSCENTDVAIRFLKPYRRWLSVVGLSENSEPQIWTEFGAERVCQIGEMQQPPLARLHNGVDWIRETHKPG
jgi:hypothetical protein